MAERSPGAIGSSTTARSSGLGDVRRPSGKTVGDGGVRSFTESPVPRGRTQGQDRPQKYYIHVEGRRFDMSAPRGTYVDILV